eukprot:12913385-Alexandrium_andersonii.AAC.1
MAWPAAAGVAGGPWERLSTWEPHLVGRPTGLRGAELAPGPSCGGEGTARQAATSSLRGAWAASELARAG